MIRIIWTWLFLAWRHLSTEISLKSNWIQHIYDPKGGILGRCREYFKGVLHQITFTPLNTQGVRLGEENTVTATEVFLSDVRSKAGEAAVCDEIYREMLRVLNREVVWLTRVCQAAWLSRWASKHWQTGVTILIYKKEDRRDSLTTGPSRELPPIF